MLARLGLRLQIVVPTIDERPLAGEAPAAHAARLAAAKADAAVATLARRGPLPAPLLAADTIVALGRRILGKPADEAEARAMLTALSGRTHEVATAYCLRPAAPVPGLLAPAVVGQAPVARTVVTKVSFRSLRPAEIEDYLRGGEWRDKAGAYAIQGVAAALVTEVRGSYTNVVGLPLCEVMEDLVTLGLLTTGALSRVAIA